MRGSQPWRTNRARVLRSQPVSAEALLWGKLRNRQFAGLKFVRQAPIEPYFVDFLCRERRIVVEVDGGTHASEMEQASDQEPELALQKLSYRVFRACNRDVYDNIDRVLDALFAFVENANEVTEHAAAPHPDPLPASGEREKKATR